VNVTAHPTAEWAVQQLRESFPGEASIQYLIHDSDSIFSDRVDEARSAFGIEPKSNAFRSPWQNGLAERWGGTVKRDLLDHVMVVDAQHLSGLLREYVADFYAERVHAVLRDAPEGRPGAERPSESARVSARRRLGGFHRLYEW